MAEPTKLEQLKRELTVGKDDARERAIEMLESKSWDQKISSLINPADALFNKVLWRGVILICILIVGLGLLRLVPQRVKDT